MKRELAWILPVLAALLGIPALIVAPSWYGGWQQCQIFEQREQLATSWTPWGGCTAVILGTRVRL